MRRNSKWSHEVKLKVVKEYLEGNGSARTLARKYDCTKERVQEWVAKYRVNGETALKVTYSNQSYTKEFKTKVAEEYLAGGISQTALANKYNIPSKRQVQNWVKLYNGHIEIRSYKASGGNRMTKGRKTTYEERIEIVSDCLENGLDYMATATKYEVSYQQIYSWVQKYNEKGVVGLKDNRGKGKSLEDMNELERMEAENKLLRAKLKRLEMELELKKKLEEVQMRLESTTRKKK